MREHDITFDAMGSHVRLLIGEPGSDMASAVEAAEGARRFVLDFDAALSRFKPKSELCALNRDPRERVPASPLLRRAVRVGLEAAERSKGLVDPTLIREIEAAGYIASRAGMSGVPLREALGVAPSRRPAAASPAARWSSFEIDDEAGGISSGPPASCSTPGAPARAWQLTCWRNACAVTRASSSTAGETSGSAAPTRSCTPTKCSSSTRSPASTRTSWLGWGGVASSGLNVRIWRDADGHFAHHLLDPASGEPAWTGLIGATALGDTAVEAETLSKAALLSGPEGGRRILAELGGFLVHDRGRVELVGALAVAPQIRIPDLGEMAGDLR